MQGQAALQMPLAARNLRPVQSSANFYLDSLGSKPQRLLNGFSHCAPESDTLFQLRGNLFSLELGVQFRFVNLLNRHQYFTSGLCRQVSLELINLGALSTDDDARTGSVDNDLQPVGSSLDIDMGNARPGETALQIALEFQILQQELTKLLLRVPMRMPVLVVAEAETVWMNFLTYSILQS